MLSKVRTRKNYRKKHNSKKRRYTKRYYKRGGGKGFWKKGWWKKKTEEPIIEKSPELLELEKQLNEIRAKFFEIYKEITILRYKIEMTEQERRHEMSELAANRQDRPSQELLELDEKIKSYNDKIKNVEEKGDILQPDHDKLFEEYKALGGKEDDLL